MTRKFSLLLVFLVFLLSGGADRDAAAQTVTTLHSFDNVANPNDGYYPIGSVVQSTDGSFYGATYMGGTDNVGVVYKITSTGTFIVLHDFSAPDPTSGENADGAFPIGSFVQGADGNFYGTTTESGASNAGTVFKITASGVLTTLVNFNLANGAAPQAGLIRGSDGNFYGTTYFGGSSNDGTVFKMTPSGTLTTLVSFTGTNGANPYAGLVQGSDGNFYGATQFGGSTLSSDPNHLGFGTVFKMTPSGTLTLLHSFNDGTVANDGTVPTAALVQGNDGNFYSTTNFGSGSLDSGVIFKITPTGVYTILNTVSDIADDSDASATLMRGSDGNFFGTEEGDADNGALFEMTPAGVFTFFFSLGDGSVTTGPRGPTCPLVQGTDGNFYGTSEEGGILGGGTVFKFTLASPSLTITSLSPAATSVGGPAFTLTIIGTGFTNNSTVVFGGIPVTVTARTATQLTVAVPANAIATFGAKTVTVTDPANGTGLDTFNVTYTPLTIIGLNPASVAVGGPVFSLAITGTNFTANSTVIFGSTPVTVTARTTTQLTATVPASAIATSNAKLVTVTDPANGTGSAVFTVTYIPLTITSLNPESISVGDPSFPLTITGTNFTNDSTVIVGETPVTVTSHTATLLTVTVPASVITTLGAKTITVSDPAHGSVSAILTVTPGWNVQDVAAVSDGTARLLWDRTDGAAGIWIMSAANTQTLAGPVYGPYQGWVAQDITAADDGTSRILWNRYDGATGVWAMDAHGNQTSVSPTYGPFSGWKAVDLATAPNGTSRLMWRYTNGEAGILTLNATGGEIIVGRNYGPYTGWTATAVGAAGDGTARMLWTRSDGAMGLWSMDSGDLQLSVGPTYGPYSDSHGTWRATDLSTSADGTSQVLWKRSDGAIGVWTFSASNAMTTVGSVYGPYSGFTAAALDAANGKSRVLWVRSDRAAGLWSFGSNDMESLIGPVYGPY